MDGPLFHAINAPVANALLQYRVARLPAAQSIAKINGFAGAYWPWQSAVTGFERSCGKSSVALVVCSAPRAGCYWLPEIHVGADTALAFPLAYRRSAFNKTLLRDIVYAVVSAIADFFASRVNRSTRDPSGNWTLLGVIGPDEHSYIVDSNAYTNAAAGATMHFAAEAADILGLSPASLADWKRKADSMLVPTAKFCLPWSNASTVGCPPSQVVTIHPQYAGYHGQDINQADVALMQWPLHLSMDAEVAHADLNYYAQRSSGSDTKGFYTGDSSYAIAMLFAGQPDAAAAQLAFANDHMLGAFNIWTETDPKVAAHNATGNLNFLTGAGGFLENIVFGYGGLRYTDAGLTLAPSLPPNGVTSLTIRGVSYSDSTVRMTVNASHILLSQSSGNCRLKVTQGQTMEWNAQEVFSRWPSQTSFTRGVPLLLQVERGT